MPVTVNYSLTYPEFCDAIRAVLPRTRPWAWILLGILIFFSLFAAWFLAVNPFGEERSLRLSGAGALLLAGGFLLLVGVVWSHASADARMWKSHPHLTEPHVFTADDDGVLEQWESTSFRTGWPNIRAWRETPGVLVITTTSGLVILPRRAMSEETYTALISLLHAKSPRGTGGFPITPSPPAPSPEPR